MLALIAAIVCGDPRAHDGPRETRSHQPEIDPFERAAPNERDAMPPDVTADRPRAPPDLLDAPQYVEPPVEPRPTGRGLLIAGGVLASTGLVVTTISLGFMLMPCSGFCEPYAAVYTGLAAPAPWLIEIAMLGVGMQRRSYDLASRRTVDGRMKPPRRGVFAAGLAMVLVGSGAIAATSPLPFINTFAQLSAGPLAIAGAIMVGAARGRRLALRDHIAIAPIITLKLPGMVRYGVPLKGGRTLNTHVLNPLFAQPPLDEQLLRNMFQPLPARTPLDVHVKRQNLAAFCQQVSPALCDQWRDVIEAGI